MWHDLYTFKFQNKVIMKGSRRNIFSKNLHNINKNKNMISMDIDMDTTEGLFKSNTDNKNTLVNLWEEYSYLWGGLNFVLMSTYFQWCLHNFDADY